MKIILILGPPDSCVDTIYHSLMKNQSTLARHNIAMPGRPRYEPQLLRYYDAPALRNHQILHDAGLSRLDLQMGVTHPTTLILGSSVYAGPLSAAIGGGGIFYDWADRIRTVRRLFPYGTVQCFMPLYHPTRLIAHVLRANGLRAFADYAALRGEPSLTPFSLYWARTLARVLDLNPNLAITVWRDEDSPLLYERLMYATTGISPSVALNGRFDLLETITQARTKSILFHYFKQIPSQDLAHRQRVVALFLNQLCRSEVAYETLAIEDWSDAIYHQLDEQYETDFGRIRSLETVSVFQPEI